MKKEMEMGFALVNALNDKQQKLAIFSDQAPSEIITGNSRKASLQHPAGISYAEMNEAQKKLFLELLDVYIKNYSAKFSDTVLKQDQKSGHG